MRRSPLIILADTSGRMVGERIARTNSFIHDLVNKFRFDPLAIETVYLSIITYNLTFSVELDFKPISEPFNLVDIKAQQSTPPLLGSALEYLSKWTNQRVHKTTNNSKGDWRTGIIICWGGGISDKDKFQNAVKLFANISVRIMVIRINADITDDLFPSDWIILNSNLTNEELMTNIYRNFWWKEDDLCCEDEPLAKFLTVLPAIIHLDL